MVLQQSRGGDSGCAEEAGRTCELQELERDFFGQPAGNALVRPTRVSMVQNGSDLIVWPSLPNQPLRLGQGA